MGPTIQALHFHGQVRQRDFLSREALMQLSGMTSAVVRLVDLERHASDLPRRVKHACRLSSFPLNLRPSQSDGPVPGSESPPLSGRSSLLTLATSACCRDLTTRFSCFRDLGTSGTLFRAFAFSRASLQELARSCRQRAARWNSRAPRPAALLRGGPWKVNVDFLRLLAVFPPLQSGGQALWRQGCECLYA